MEAFYGSIVFCFFSHLKTGHHSLQLFWRSLEHLFLWNFSSFGEFPFNTDASHLTYISKWDEEMEITILSFVIPLPNPLSQQKYYETLYATQTRSDSLLIRSMIDLQEDIFLQIISIFYVYGQTDIVQGHSTTTPGPLTWTWFASASSVCGSVLSFIYQTPPSVHLINTDT